MAQTVGDGGPKDKYAYAPPDKAIAPFKPRRLSGIGKSGGKGGKSIAISRRKGR